MKTGQAKRLGQLMFQGFKHVCATHALEMNAGAVGMEMQLQTGISRDSLFKYKDGKNKPHLSQTDIEAFAHFCVNGGTNLQWAQQFLVTADYYGSESYASATDFLQELFPNLRLVRRASNSISLQFPEIAPNNGTQNGLFSSGPVALQSPFYIEREGDQKGLTAVAQPLTSIITVQGARQTGKSSLLLRLAHAATQNGQHNALLDFRLLELETAVVDHFYREFCVWISEELELPDNTEKYWSRNTTNLRRCTRYIQTEILLHSEQPITVFIDEADRLFNTTFYAGFFAMLRAWHEKSAHDMVWQRLTLGLATSTEPHLYIQDLSQSPFNVGVPIHLDDFDLTQIEKLNRRHDCPLTRPQITELWTLLGGQPYLTRQAFYQVSNDGVSPDKLFATATDLDGPFADHLHSLMIQRLGKQTDLKQAMQQIIAQETPAATKLITRLESAGLVKRQAGQVIPRCKLYSDFFERYLNS